ncbi:MAG: hypothetical protein K0R54_4343 [Clostridiaceae bacterium]|jgi:hypothetical protein|nr:hypothetical protein [Clostridiaceae bacterium]
MLSICKNSHNKGLIPCIRDIKRNLVRYEEKYLDNLGLYNSSDRSSGATGNIIIRNKDNNEVYESV